MSKEMMTLKLSAKSKALGAGPVNGGDQKLFTLPSEEEQATGFTVSADEGRRILQTYGGRFKEVVSKGDDKGSKSEEAGSDQPVTQKRAKKPKE